MMFSKNGSLELLNSKNYIFEPKVDGYRALCIKNKKGLKFITRRDHDITANFPEFKFKDNIKAQNCILDGEIVVYDEKGRPSFEHMQNKLNKHYEAVYIVFDILEKNKKDLKNLPLEERKKILSETIIEDHYLELMPFFKEGKKLWKKANQYHLEGVMAKKKGSIYQDNRNTDWLKIKRQKTVDCVIIGIIKKKREISSLALGLYDKKHKLKFIGKVGTGFSEKMIQQLSKILKQGGKVPETFSGNLPRELLTVIPNKVCEIKYLELTQDYRLRIPVFLRLREDKLPSECTIDQLKL